jgi:hypothetical protein
MIDVFHSTLHILLDEQDDVESKQAFAELCRFLTDSRQRLKRVDNIIQTIERTASERGIELPLEAVDVIDFD